MKLPRNRSPRFQCARSIGNSTRRVLRYELLEDRRLLAAVVTSTSPLTGSKAVPVDTDIEATFNTVISPASVTDQTFVVHRGQGGQLLSSLGDITSLAGVGPVVALDPADIFYPGELVQVTATASLLDDSSTAVTPYVWDFRAATTGGSGTFEDSGQALGSATGWHVALGDVDSDGDLDAIVSNLQVVNLPEQVSRLWLNQGGLQAGIVGQYLDSGQSLDNTRPHDLALGDLDADGDLDIFFGNSSYLPNSIWINQGGLQGGIEGVFADSGQSLGTGPTRGVSLGDLDGDGDLDAFVANRADHPNLVWINQGGLQGGTIGQLADSGQLLGDSWSYDVELGDVDNDGDLDAFVANHGPFAVADGDASQIWLNNGTGVFSDSGQLLGDTSSRAVSLGDVDGDGDLDAFIANGDGDKLWINQGGLQGGTTGQFVDSGQTLGNSTSHDLSLGDLDGDGDLDAVVVSAGTESNTVWINQGGTQGGIEGQFADSGQSLGSSDSRGVALGDLDNDGDLDAFEVNRGVGEPDRVWINRSPSADFDEDDDIDGADLLAWQRGYGMTSGAAIADGDANADGAVDGVDLAVWVEQFGSSASPIAATFESQSVETPMNLIAAESATSVLQRPDVGFYVWLAPPTNGHKVANQIRPHRMASLESSPPSIRQVDLAFENLFHVVSDSDMRRSALRPIDEDLELLGDLRTSDDTIELENVDAMLADWEL